jgi:hypothetical protein
MRGSGYLTIEFRFQAAVSAVHLARFRGDDPGRNAPGSHHCENNVIYGGRVIYAEDDINGKSRHLCLVPGADLTLLR